jgi:hypothetical protein
VPCDVSSKSLEAVELAGLEGVTRGHERAVAIHGPAGERGG